MLIGSVNTLQPQPWADTYS